MKTPETSPPDELGAASCSAGFGQTRSLTMDDVIIALQNIGLGTKLVNEALAEMGYTLIPLMIAGGPHPETSVVNRWNRRSNAKGDSQSPATMNTPKTKREAVDLDRLVRHIAGLREKAQKQEAQCCSQGDYRQYESQISGLLEEADELQSMILPTTNNL